ncbi:MAG: hypothetical protein ACERKD_05395 [Prolixibacteraceae bacterium]
MPQIKFVLKLIIVFTLILIFYGCPTPCGEMQINTVSPIADSILNYIPYHNGDEVILEHSAGTKIIFNAERESKTEISYCDRCCDSWEYHFDRTVLTPNYPIHPIVFELVKYEENYSDFNVTVGISTFRFPTYDLSALVVDSILINNKMYFSVFTLKAAPNENYYGEEFAFFADSLYYNSEFGILKLTMSNNEYYLRDEN